MSLQNGYFFASIWIFENFFPFKGELKQSNSSFTFLCDINLMGSFFTVLKLKRTTLTYINAYQQSYYDNCSKCVLYYDFFRHLHFQKKKTYDLFYVSYNHCHYTLFSRLQYCQSINVAVRKKLCFFFFFYNKNS